jgi:dienelactone hydrolase
VKTVVILVACLAVGSGCMSVPLRKPVRLAEPVPAELQAAYAYDSITAAPVLLSSVTNRCFTLRNLRLVAPPAESEPIELVWYAPTNHSDRPLILVAPIGGNEKLIVPALARFFAVHGYHAVIVKRPSDHLDAERPVTQIEDYVRRGVVRNRQALDWLLKQPGVDAHRAASFGISYGAILNAATAAVEPRLRCHVFVLAGAPLPEVIVKSAEPRLRKYRRQLHAQSGMTDRQLLEQLRTTIRSDPARLAPYVNSDDVLTFIALFDRSVGTSHAFRLWRAQGEPRAELLPTGHYTALLYLPFLRCQAMKFFEAKLGPAN